uniref:Uncharacterized protein n=1 Tax=Odontella aurita TaxID=265563 RepID=A0A7S4MX76_9STRA|mmetsp:Transcript_38116/g.113911  ORF Transcript_38116/g.113911 Transcript_38116/m.113911 type:complete len:449 (+) Transcript_38116:128-1474(+)
MSHEISDPGGTSVGKEITAVGKSGAIAELHSLLEVQVSPPQELPCGDDSNSHAAVPSRPRRKRRRALDQDLGSKNADGLNREDKRYGEKRGDEIQCGGEISRCSRRQRDSFDGVLSARKKNRRKSASGHISAADAKVATLPPLPPCTVGDARKKTKGCCFQCPKVTEDVDFQQRLRDLYVKTVREAPESGHAYGTGLLATMLRPHVRDPKEIIRKKLPHLPDATTTCMWCRRKESTAKSPRHKFSHETCPDWDNAMTFVRENQSERMLPRVPWIAPDGTRDGTYFDVHVETFKLLFNVSQGRLNHIRSLAKGGAVPSSEDVPVGDPEALPDLDRLDKRRKGSGGHNRLADEQVEGLLRVLQDALCRTDPLTREYRFGSDLSLAWFWKRYLKTTGEDEAFLAQAERMNFYPTYDRLRRNKKLTDDQYAEDPKGKKLMPSVSYAAAIEVR